MGFWRFAVLLSRFGVLPFCRFSHFGVLPFCRFHVLFPFVLYLSSFCSFSSESCLLKKRRSPAPSLASTGLSTPARSCLLRKRCSPWRSLSEFLLPLGFPALPTPFSPPEPLDSLLGSFPSRSLPSLHRFWWMSASPWLPWAEDVLLVQEASWAHRFPCSLGSESIRFRRDHVG